MSRPIKDGVDYFPLDVVMDEKIDLIEAEFGLTGFAVVVKLYQWVYGRGYYCEWTKEVALLFGKKIGLGGNAVSEIVSASIRRGIFDQTMFEKYGILTSAGIQTRYFEAVSRRKLVNVEKRYLLVKVDHLSKNGCINWINVDKNPENVSNNSQSKVKESKGKESKENKSNGDGGLHQVLDFYEQNIGLVSSYIIWEIQNWLDEGFGSDLIVEALAKSVAVNARNWKYAEGVLRSCRNRNIKTLQQFKADEVGRNGTDRGNVDEREKEAWCRGGLRV